MAFVWFFVSVNIGFVLLYIWDRLFSLQGLPSTLPWAGAKDGRLSMAKARCRSFFGMRDLICNGYYEFSNIDRPFILSNLVTGPEVILPMSQFRWLVEQPDHILNQNEVNREFLHADRTMLHSNIIRDSVHANVIRREMTKELDSYCNDIVEEIDHALALNWGTDPKQSREVLLYDTMLDVVGRISNRVLVGPMLCRNKDYLWHSRNFSRYVVITAALINLLPPVLRPLLGPIITLKDTHHYRRISRHIFPIVRERSAAFCPGMDDKKPDYSEHNDYVQWALHDAYSREDPTERTAEMITKRLAVLSFAAIQSSVITITNVIFDICSSPLGIYIQQGLRDEVRQVTSQHPNTAWTKASLAQMIHLDSTLRESLRLWGFISRAVMKMVVPPEGVRIPSGEFVPPGAKIGVTAYAVHHDESVYPDAYRFDAFRFSRAQENRAPGKRSVRPSDDEPPKGPSVVTSSEHFMAFSHGRHACPGRFFAANQLKLLLARIALKYDLEPIAKRPVNPWLNNTIGPPIWAKVRVRYRGEDGGKVDGLGGTGRGEAAEVGMGKEGWEGK